MNIADIAHHAMVRLLRLEDNTRIAQTAARDAADALANARAAMHTRIEAEDLSRLEQDLPRLIEQAEATSNRYTSLSATVDRCRRWIESLPEGTTFGEIHLGDYNFVENTSPEEFEKMLRETRQQLAAAIKERNDLAKVPTPSADIEARVRDHIAELAQRAKPYVRGVSAGETLSVRWPPKPTSTVMDTAFWTMDTCNPLLLAALLHPDQLADVILTQIAREANTGLTVKQRETRIAKLTDDIDQLQRDASDLVFYLVQSGHVETFHQAPPEAVLGVFPQEIAA